ncbi:hypothetical protein SPRG_05051 [Saprolegnia parasitica CBS 223.65]|uniref:RING-type domain-containing protein n=1 Tax=Saprolegnia parasitica (strain CBS 223.65) TaxID=695850 RepID=A0A067CM88_SAPPC|nr:hypothetical protein SPRG_05051 [Saprolegnia parasitica CBS 223.65]KDO30340.1 hypothetical protein SPRG_05051 [Saprolegnia parasitica CBS 223.65]|eukprot:XP_012198950.1 hypothetical protein SPRG_05051 [Saprolegnia parasitica CBS 223.65]
MEAEDDGPPMAMLQTDVFRALQANLMALVRQSKAEAEALRRQLIESNEEVERLKERAQRSAALRDGHGSGDEDEAMVESDDDDYHNERFRTRYHDPYEFDEEAHEQRLRDMLEAQQNPPDEAFASDDDDHNGETQGQGNEPTANVSDVGSDNDAGSDNEIGAARYRRRQGDSQDGEAPNPSYEHMENGSGASSDNEHHESRERDLSSDEETPRKPMHLRKHGPVTETLPLPPLRANKPCTLTDAQKGQISLKRLLYYRHKSLLEKYEAHARARLAEARRISIEAYDEARALHEDFSTLTNFVWPYFETQSWPRDVELDIECSICAHSYKADECVVTLTCMHLFHNDCAKPWFEAHEECPQCKTIVIPTRDTLGRRP